MTQGRPRTRRTVGAESETELMCVSTHGLPVYTFWCMHIHIGTLHVCIYMYINT